jgi:SAM-dependent methyltransferase
VPWGDSWLTATWPFVRSALPQSPASVLELGCGPEGGFVPRLLDSGYQAVGVDRNAPAGAGFHQLDFEHYDPPRPVDAVVACRSLHHVDDPADVARRIAEALRPGGALVVVEWAWERFDEQTARWCRERLEPAEAEEDHGWLQRRLDGWLASGEAWDAYFVAWAGTHGIHRAERILGELDGHFERTSCAYAPYFFAELGNVAEAEEQAAIDAGEIRATGIRYVGARSCSES